MKKKAIVNKVEVKKSFNNVSSNEHFLYLFDSMINMNSFFSYYDKESIDCKKLLNVYLQSIIIRLNTEFDDMERSNIKLDKCYFCAEKIDFNRDRISTNLIFSAYNDKEDNQSLFDCGIIKLSDITSTYMHIVTIDDKFIKIADNTAYYSCGIEFVNKSEIESILLNTDKCFKLALEMYVYNNRSEGINNNDSSIIKNLMKTYGF